MWKVTLPIDIESTKIQEFLTGITYYNYSLVVINQSTESSKAVQNYPDAHQAPTSDLWSVQSK